MMRLPLRPTHQDASLRDAERMEARASGWRSGRTFIDDFRASFRRGRLSVALKNH